MKLLTNVSAAIKEVVATVQNLLASHPLLTGVALGVLLVKMVLPHLHVL